MAVDRPLPFALGAFRAISRVQGGGMAAVYRGVHVPSGIEVALKVLPPHGGDAWHHEQALVASLDHPHVIAVHDLGRTERGEPWIAMEWADAGTARARRPRSYDALLAVLRAILAGLGHAHGRGVLHRDVKPDNVLGVGAGPRWVLADFGVARGGPARGTGFTSHFAAPEQREGRWRAEGPWTDVFAVGRTALSLARGFPVPAELARWIALCTAEAPGRRFPSAADAAWALDHLDRLPSDPDARRSTSTDPIGARTWSSVDEAATSDAIPEPVPAGLAAPPVSPTPPRQVAPRVAYGVGAGLLGLRALPPIGREREQQALWDALVACERAPVAVVLTGPEGVGRTALAAWVLEAAIASGAAFGLRVEPGPPDAVERAALTALGLADLRAEDLDGALADRGLGAGDRAAVCRPATARPAARALAWVALLRRVARDRRVVVIGTGPADATWRALVEASLREPALAALLVAPAGVEVPGAQVVAVEPSAELPLAMGLREHLGLTHELAVRVARRSGGLAELAASLVGRLHRQGRLVLGTSGLHASLDEVEDVGERWAATTAGLDPSTLHALELAATLGSPLDLERWEAARGGLPSAPVVAGLVRSERTWVLHPGLCEALRASARAAGRLERWREVALATAADPASRAPHLAALGRWAEAADAWLATSERDRDAGRVVEALEGAEQALEASQHLDPADPRRGRVALLRALLLVVRGRIAEAQQVTASVGADLERHGWAELRHRLAYLRSLCAQHGGRAEEAEEHLLDAIAGAPDVAGARTEYLRQLADVRVRNGRQQEALVAAEAALSDARAAGDRRQASWALRQLGVVQRRLSLDSGPAVEEAWREGAEDPELVAILWIDRGQVHRVHREDDRAVACFRAGAAEFRRLGSPNEVFGALLAANVDLDRHDWAGALATLETCPPPPRDGAGWSGTSVSWRLSAAYALGMLGRWHEAEDQLAAAIEGQRGRTVREPSAAERLARIRVAAVEAGRATAIQQVDAALRAFADGDAA